jgi:hypothetical protein
MAKTSNDAAGNATEIYSAVRSKLHSLGMSDDRASSYAAFSLEVYNCIQNDPKLQTALKLYKGGKDLKDVKEGLQGGLQANHLLQNAIEMGSSTRVIEGFKNVRATGVAGVLSVFVDRFEGYAKHHGIELNECSLQVTKVCVDIVVGGAAATTGWGLVLTGFCVLATSKDSYGLGKACFTAQ